ncbi:MAG: hypothetical protein BZ138_05980 [Methanosphaera sp. rholeuAM270]|nr:MAG: hypothetical protein BZ138_05980 [Methanosphaera sp. rholeuAM270]
MTTVTNHMLRKELENVGSNAIPGLRNAKGVIGIPIIEQKLVVAVENELLIFQDGTSAHLYSPLPCLHWKFMGNTSDGNVLKSQFSALVLNIDGEQYVLGLDGYSNEFEIRCTIGDSEIRMNKDFVSIKSPHLVRNGLEVIENNGT